jgi:hypothetical protein
VIEIILYLGGNFPALSNPKEECKIIEKIKTHGSEYHRLVTFFHEKEARVAINLQKEMKQPILRKRGNDERIILHKKTRAIGSLE